MTLADSRVRARNRFVLVHCDIIPSSSWQSLTQKFDKWNRFGTPSRNAESIYTYSQPATRDAGRSSATNTWETCSRQACRSHSGFKWGRSRTWKSCCESLAIVWHISYVDLFTGGWEVAATDRASAVQRHRSKNIRREVKWAITITTVCATSQNRRAFCAQSSRLETSGRFRACKKTRHWCGC